LGIAANNVLLVKKIEGPVWYTIYHHLPVDKGVNKPLFFHQPTNGKSTSMIAAMSQVGSIPAAAKVRQQGWNH